MARASAPGVLAQGVVPLGEAGGLSRGTGEMLAFERISSYLKFFSSEPNPISEPALAASTRTFCLCESPDLRTDLLGSQAAGREHISIPLCDLLSTPFLGLLHPKPEEHPRKHSYQPFQTKTGSAHSPNTGTCALSYTLSLSLKNNTITNKKSSGSGSDRFSAKFNQTSKET